jgi:hypothetical protein
MCLENKEVSYMNTIDKKLNINAINAANVVAKYNELTYFVKIIYTKYKCKKILRSNTVDDDYAIFVLDSIWDILYYLLSERALDNQPQIGCIQLNRIKQLKSFMK